MIPLNIRGLKIGEGIPKICVPILGGTKESILKQAKELDTDAADFVEWRVDWFEEAADLERVKEILSDLRGVLQDMPLLFTFRTAKEGGKRSIGILEYAALNQTAAKTGDVDFIDVEAFLDGKEEVENIIKKAHEYGVKVIASNHDFKHTPKKEEIIRRLCQMQELGADIVKIAVMPKEKTDVFTLLSATDEMYTKYADRPIITMSMSQLGVMSRLCGEQFGSAVTFGCAGQASAPGQLTAAQLKTILSVLHKM